jgi:hypothetical protein
VGDLPIAIEDSIGTISVMRIEISVSDQEAVAIGSLSHQNLESRLNPGKVSTSEFHAYDFNPLIGLRRGPGHREVVSQFAEVQFTSVGNFYLPWEIGYITYPIVEAEFDGGDSAFVPPSVVSNDVKGRPLTDLKINAAIPSSGVLENGD